MKQVWNWIKSNPNRTMFLVPIILVAIISISHVVSWYDMANPINWAIYLSIAIEVGAMTALVAATNKIKGGVWFMFGLVTLIQMIGNIFYSYVQIDETGELFKKWVELTGPVWEMMGTELNDVVGLKRYLAFLEGGLLPLISLTSLHFFVKYETSGVVVENSNNDVTPKHNFNTTPKHNFNTTSEKNNTTEMSDNVVNNTYDESHTTDMVLNNIVDDVMEEKGYETISDLVESLNEERKIEPIETTPVKEEKIINNPFPVKKKMGIDRIQ